MSVLRLTAISSRAHGDQFGDLTTEREVRGRRTDPRACGSGLSRGILEPGELPPASDRRPGRVPDVFRNQRGHCVAYALDQLIAIVE